MASAVTCKVDRSRLLRDLHSIRRGLPTAREHALTAMGREFALVLERYWPRDTNRSARGWLIAANEAGLGPLIIPPVKSSKFADQWLLRLGRQLNKASQSYEFWSKIVDHRYERTGRKGKWYTDALKHRDNASKRLEAARRELKRFNKIEGEGGGAIVIFGNSKKRSLDLTVRYKIYGGRGRRIETGTTSYAELANLEPHVRIVESRSRIVASGMAQLRSFGVKRAGAKFMTELGKASNIVRGGQASFIR